MSKLDELIAELCPDGVEYVKLGDIGHVAMCKRILKSDTNTLGGVPFYKIGTFGKKADAYISVEKFLEYKAKYSYPKKGAILISAAGTIGRTVIFDGAPSYYQDSNIVWLEHDESVVLNKYLYYCYAMNPWYIQSGGTIPRLYNDNITKATIPLPPLPVQQEIVRILDSFTKYKAELELELEAELEARKKQYEYYRNSLLSFEGDNSVKWMKLEDICLTIGDGLHGTPKYVEYSDYAFINGNNLANGKILITDSTKFVDFEEYKKHKIELNKDTVLMSINGTIGKLALYDDETIILGKSASYITVNYEILNRKYLYYYLQTEYTSNRLFSSSTGSTIKNLGLANIRKYKIPVPPLSEQQRIVSILDRFDALCNDITTGLPAEIAARQKQYEYYRDKLLTFKEKV